MKSSWSVQKDCGSSRSKLCSTRATKWLSSGWDACMECPRDNWREKRAETRDALRPPRSQHLLGQAIKEHEERRLVFLGIRGLRGADAGDLVLQTGELDGFCRHFSISKQKPVKLRAKQNYLPAGCG